MLGSLARKLRAFGFDTAYYRAGGDEGIIGLARAEGRVILTSDRPLGARAKSKGVRVFMIEGRTDGRRISSLISSARAQGVPLERGDPLCSVCGGGLVVVPRKRAAFSVPALVAARHRLFFRCMSCGRFYWRGAHWKKLSNLERAFGHRVRRSQVSTG
jgi:hypothetical protein